MTTPARHCLFYRFAARNRISVAHRNLPGLLIPLYLTVRTVITLVRALQKEPGTYPEFARALLACYTQVRTLPADSVQLLEPYLLLRDVFILNFVTVAAPVNTDVASWGPARVAGVMANMQAYVEGHPYPGTLIPEQS
ncbi:hypothetical protein ACIO8F_40275 [Streptomyces sp. NPDC087228]|uniref:hypothetical protein n=1 Tax=unclassified Streptomyces TaxID=2593676 RepID=UPI0033E6C6A5